MDTNVSWKFAIIATVFEMKTWLARWRVPIFLLASALLILAIALASNVLPLSFPPAQNTPLQVSDFPNPHELSEGVTLGAQKKETVFAAERCPQNAPTREYRIAAIPIEITLNRFFDYDPHGRMYVLESELARVRDEESRNQRARAMQDKRASLNAVAVSLGLQGDAIQPLTLRVNQGECLRVVLKNLLSNNEPASFHLHGSSLYLAEDGSPALALNPRATIFPNEQVTYEWMVRAEEPEGTHYFHSHGDDRMQSAHGLFGAVIVEPSGARYFDPRTGLEKPNGWDANIQLPDGRAFREFALYYHEIGNDTYLTLTKDGQPSIFVDRLSGAYRPASRALNYRSEPFYNRLKMQQELEGKFDKSAAYSSYTFGDPATPILRAYLGDAVKERVIHGGSEVFHVHHVHGGATRWRRQPNAEPGNLQTGLNKHPALVPQTSERTDSQSFGPSETFDVENECGAGGCQQSVGDYLFHCHVAHHYFAGMWGLWRVYNTLQNTDPTGRTTDELPSLQELPNRVGEMPIAVTSKDLGRITFAAGNGQTRDLKTWVEAQLPPQGKPRGYDASVLDWTRDGELYLNESNDARVWEGYSSRTPNEQPAILFDPRTGKLAYPFLRPHLGKRPPFAPNHGPAPYLDPIANGLDPPTPGANGEASVCPQGTRLKNFTIEAVGLPIAINKRMNLIDPLGALFVLKNQERDVRAREELQTPLAIRANAGQDCVDVIFKTQLPDNQENANFSKADIHIHFVQFDVQASDGVNAGFNYEQSVRPYTVEGERIASDLAQGAQSARVPNAARFHANTLVGVGMEQEATFEIARVARIENDTLHFDAPLKFAHRADEIISAEFVRYRWYPDVQSGAAYFHDHVDGIQSWRHGLFGALIVEPPDATYHDPYTGKEIASGAVADIHTQEKISVDVQGSFRELVTFLQDSNFLTFIGDSAGSSINLRAEPLARRMLEPKEIPKPFDPLKFLREILFPATRFDDKSAYVFSSAVFGDPATPRLETYLGDPFVIRTLVGGTNDVHQFHLDGHAFRAELWSRASPPLNTVTLGISERYDLVVPRAGGAQQMAGDYLYYNARDFKLREGSWGIVRVQDANAKTNLQKLPAREKIPASNPRLCPSDAPIKQFDVDAIEAPLPMLDGAMGRVFVLHAERDEKRERVEPLVLRVNVGDCIRLTVRNQIPSSAVSVNAQMLAFDPQTSYGIAAGNNPAQHINPNETRAYEFFASPEIGETVALLRDGANVFENPRLGLYGAIVVGARGTRYTDPRTGQDSSGAASWRADAQPVDGRAYRDFVLFLQDEDAGIGTHRMPYVERVAGVVGLNYQRASIYPRRNTRGAARTLFATDAFGDPSTPLLEANAGDALRVHVLVPFSEQTHVFSIENHSWEQEVGLRGANRISSIQIGALQALTLHIENAGNGAAGDYLYGDHRAPYQDVGLWGILRVR